MNLNKNNIFWIDDEIDLLESHIIYLTEKESNAIDLYEDMICRVYYDHVVNNTKKEIDKICGFLKKQPHDNIAELIKKETRNIDIISSRSDKKNQIYNNIKDKNSFEKLMYLGEIYENYISV